MAPIEYKPEAGIVLLANKGLKISLKGNAAISAVVNMTQINIGENSTSMGRLVAGGCLITIIGPTFKAAYNLANFSFEAAAGIAVSNYASKSDVKFTNLTASYSEIANDNGVVVDSIRTASEIQNSCVKKTTLGSTLNVIESYKQEINCNCSLMAETLNKIQQNKQSATALYDEVCQKKEELASLKKVIANLLNEVKTTSSSAVANKKVVAQNDSETGLHTCM